MTTLAPLGTFIGPLGVIMTFALFAGDLAATLGFCGTARGPEGVITTFAPLGTFMGPYGVMTTFVSFGAFKILGLGGEPTFTVCTLGGEGALIVWTLGGLGGLGALIV